MNLHVVDNFWVNDYHDFRKCLDEKYLRIFDYVVAKHFEQEVDAIVELEKVLKLYLEKIHPNKLVYCECDGPVSVIGKVFDIPKDLIETVRTSLEMPQEDLPTKINTKNPITKTIINWRLKNG